MRRARDSIVLACCLGLGLAACDRSGSSTDPDSAARLDRYEGGSVGKAGAGDPQAESQQGEQELPKVRDRDPEEEKRKMAESRKYSAQAERSLRAGRLDQAVSQSRQALKVHEQNVDAMLVIAEVFYRQNKFELTQAVAGSALAVDEKIRTPQQTSRAHNLQGFAHVAMGNDRAATQAFKSAAETDDKNASAWNNLGTRYLAAGDAKTAQSCFEYAIELRPSFPKAHLNLGAAHRAQRKWAEAEKAFLEALRLQKNYAEAYFNLGVLYLDADPFPGLDTVKRLNKAVDYLKKYKSTSPGNDASPKRRTAKGKPGTQPGPAPVSHARADDYIRVAQKGLQREQRAQEREAKRQSQAASADAEASKAGGGPTQLDPAAAESGAETGSGATEPSQPQQPPAAKPQSPGSQPSAPKKPAPPSETPSEPKKPAPPSDEPSEPKKPAPPNDEPSDKPSEPQKPPAQKPPAQKPPAQKPPAQKPGVQRPAPQKPGQKNASAWNPRQRQDTKRQRGARVSSVAGHVGEGRALEGVDVSWHRVSCQLPGGSPRRSSWEDAVVTDVFVANSGLPPVTVTVTVTMRTVHG